MGLHIYIHTKLYTHSWVYVHTHTHTRMKRKYKQRGKKRQTEFVLYSNNTRMKPSKNTSIGNILVESFTFADNDVA